MAGEPARPGGMSGGGKLRSARKLRKIDQIGKLAEGMRFELTKEVDPL